MEPILSPVVFGCGVGGANALSCFMFLFVFLSACTFVCHMCALSMIPKEGDGSPETGVADSYEPPC